MHRYLIFHLLTLVLFAGCRPASIQTAVRPTHAETVQIPAENISATLAALPSNPNIRSSQTVLRTFFDAYNGHDLAGVLATFAETFAYGDCDFEKRQMLVFETKPDLATWLQTKFADADHFQVIEIIIAPPEGSPANDPRLTAVKVSRPSETLNGLAWVKQSFFKIVLNEQGNRIQFLNTYGNLDCEAGR